MIETLEDLAAFTDADARALPPSMADHALIKTPGLSADEVAALHALLPGLPDSYLDCVSRVTFWRAQLAGFFLWPPSGRHGQLRDRLAEANERDDLIAADVLRAHDLLAVASAEIDPICVRRRGASGRPGEVVWVDLTSAPEPVVRPLAPDFATFLIVAGRLEQASREGSDLDDVLAGYIDDQGHRQVWEVHASMML